MAAAASVLLTTSKTAWPFWGSEASVVGQREEEVTLARGTGSVGLGAQGQ